MRLVFVSPGRADPASPIASFCRAARRRSPTSPSFARTGLGRRPPRPCPPRRARPRRLRRLPDAGPARRRPRRRGGLPGRSRGSACSTSRPCSRREDSGTRRWAKDLVSGAAFSGYEMHVGRTDGPDCARPLLRFADGRVDGAVARDGRVAGCTSMASSPTTASAPLSWPCSAPAVGRLRGDGRRHARRARRPSGGASRLDGLLAAAR